MTEIENETKIALKIVVIDKMNKIYDKGTVYPYQSKVVDLTDVIRVRFIMECNAIFGDYLIMCPIKKLIVGQVIAKKQIISSAYFVWVDMPEIRIHNLTGCPLLLNGHIVVSPREILIYRGRDQNGIQNGLILQDSHGIFKDFQLMHPVTDVYYGVIEDHRIPAFTETYYTK